MRILYVIDSLGSGGAQRQIVTLAKMLKEKTYEVSVLCYAQENFFAKSLEEADIPIHWEIEPNYLKRIFRVRRFIRKGNYDTVISFLDTPNFLNCFAGVGGKKWKIITSERSDKKENFLSMQGKIFAWFQRYADALICNSHNAKSNWLKYYPQYKEKLGVIYNPVILPDISTKYTPKINDKLHIVIAASYQYLKNPVGLIKALALLDEYQKRQIKVDWYGEKNVSLGGTKAYEEAIRCIDKNNLRDTITLNDSTKDIINIMYQADAVALFSELEGLPNAVLEGMMLGKPIIMSKVSDYAVLVDKNNGSLCDWDNHFSIKEALISVMSLPVEELTKMGCKSKERALNLFSQEIIQQEWLKQIIK